MKYGPVAQPSQGWLNLRVVLAPCLVNKGRAKIKHFSADGYTVMGDDLLVIKGGKAIAKFTEGEWTRVESKNVPHLM